MTAGAFVDLSLLLHTLLSLLVRLQTATSTLNVCVILVCSQLMRLAVSHAGVEGF